MLSSFENFKKQYLKLHPRRNSNVILKKYTKALRQLNFGTGIKKHRFYDDDPNNIELVSQDPRIQCILVQRRQMSDGTKGRKDSPEYNGYQFLTNQTIPSRTYDEHLAYAYNLFSPEKRQEHTDLITFMDLMHNQALHQQNEKHVSEAFDENMITECRQWAGQLLNQELQRNTQNEFIGSVFFDFDQVINAVEGMSVLNSAEDMERQFNVHISGIVKYLIGSPERLQLLRNLFTDLESKKIRVYILTNNK